MKEEDYHINENGKVVFSRGYHLRRSFCCGSGCVNCPYEPKHTKGVIDVEIRERDRSEDSSTQTLEGEENHIQT
jgi:hypothetical protein